MMNPPRRRRASTVRKQGAPTKQCRCAACDALASGTHPGAWMTDVANDIRTAGWSVAAVLGDEVNPPWAYTTGLWATHQVPELTIAGLPVEHMTIILNSIAERVTDGLHVEVADEIEGICPCTLTIRPVHASWRETNIFSVSDRYYGYVRPQYLQVVWPDRRGRFPGDRGFQPKYDGRQPMLWLPAEDHPPGPWTRIDQLAA